MFEAKGTLIGYICPFCKVGTSTEMVSRGLKHCVLCGGAFEPVQGLKCSECGKDVEATWAFCAYCGAPSGIEPPELPEPEPVKQSKKVEEIIDPEPGGEE